MPVVGEVSPARPAKFVPVAAPKSPRNFYQGLFGDEGQFSRQVTTCGGFSKPRVSDECPRSGKGGYCLSLPRPIKRLLRLLVVMV